jgi:hypothetical protein
MSLTSTERKFLQGIVAARPPARSSDVAKSMSEHFGVGQMVRSMVLYSEVDYAKAAQLLQTNKVPVQALAPDASRGDAALHGGQSEKSGTRGPHSDSVALKVLGECDLHGHRVWAPGGGYLVCTVADAARIAGVDRLLLVENLETFREIERYTWIGAAGHNVLVMYRGDRALSVADSMQLLQARGEPVWAFFDFDPAGLGTASGIPRLERLVLPPPAWLAEHLDGDRQRELYARSAPQWSGVLEAATSLQISAAWSLMRQRRAGMAQEAMRDVDRPRQ